MSQEYNSLIAKYTGELVPPPLNDKVIGGMWILVKKLNEFNEVSRYKARWVCFANHQEFQKHYFETYASKARNESFKVMLRLTVQRNLHIFQFDVETAFFYGVMDAPVYISQVACFEQKGRENWVWKLNKSLYGTKQASRQWQKHLNNTLQQLGFTPSISDSSLYFNQSSSIIIHIYVDDGLIFGELREEIIQFMEDLKKNYTLKVKERPSQHLGYCLDWKPDGSVLIHQQPFCEKILEEFKMLDSKIVLSPAPMNLHEVVSQDSALVDFHKMQKAIGMLNFLALHTRPDITFTTNLLAQFARKPNASHWSAVKNLLRYLKGTQYLGIHHTQSNNPHQQMGWEYADYAMALNTKKSTSSVIICLFDNPIYWKKKKRSIVVKNTSEAEMIAVNLCLKQMRWLSNLILDIYIHINKPIIYNDNSGTVVYSKNSIINIQSRHVDIKYKYINDLVDKNLISVVPISTDLMLADMLTKTLGPAEVAQANDQLRMIYSDLRRSVGKYANQNISKMKNTIQKSQNIKTEIFFFKLN